MNIHFSKSVFAFAREVSLDFNKFAMDLNLYFLENMLSLPNDSYLCLEMFC